MPGLMTTPPSLSAHNHNRLVPGTPTTGKVKKPKTNSSTKARPTKAPSPKGPKLRNTILLFLLKWCVIMGVWAVMGLSAILLYYAHDLPDIGMLKVAKKVRQVTILAADGEVLANYGNIYGDYVRYQDIPTNLVNAVVATEDRRFFDHCGIDIWGLIRAAYVNYHAGYVVQGGSTLTQQLAKIVFLSPDRTLKRKVQEMMLALYLEHNFSKEQILTLYLNRVYMGAGLYGVSAAAKYYLGKPLQQITLPEAAMIAGLLKAPSRYAPTNNSELSGKRAYQILVNMEDAGFISKETLAAARIMPIVLETSAMGSLKNPYFADWVMEQLPDFISNTEDDLVIKTTFHPELQKMAEDAMESVMVENSVKLKASQGAMVVLSPQGEVRAMIGGRGYEKSPFNRAVKARRQPGSAFKLFVYLAAFEQGYRPEQMMTDAPITIRNWQPKNYEGGFSGSMSLRTAFAKSVNTIAVRLSEQVGRANVIRTAHKLGIVSSLPSHPSIALGSAEVNLLELTASYATIANQGRAVWPYGILSVATRKGKLLYKREGSAMTQVASPNAVRYMTDALRGVIDYGTGKAARLDRPAAGKTGTTSDFRDAWFIGFTRELVAGVWIGNDNNSPMKHVTGGLLPARIWKDFMAQATIGKPVESLETAPDMPETHNNDERESFWNKMMKNLGE